MRRIRRRLLDALLVVWIVGTLSFVLVRLAPGDPVTATLVDTRIPPAIRAQWRTTYALDASLPVQYVSYVRQLARFDLGYSFSQSRPTIDALRDTVPYSLLLMTVALCASVIVGAALGTWQALRVGTRSARWSAGLMSAVSSVPEVWLALVLLALFGAQLGWLPMSGRCAPAQCGSGAMLARVADTLRHLALPVLTLTLLYTAYFARVQRTAMLDVLDDDVMRTASAKGVSRSARVWRHGVRRAARPLLTAVGLSLPMLIGGAVFVERVFAWPGMGLLLIGGIAVRDYPLVTATAVLGALLVVIGGGVAELCADWLDPHARREA